MALLIFVSLEDANYGAHCEGFPRRPSALAGTNVYCMSPCAPKLSGNRYWPKRSWRLRSDRKEVRP